MKKTLVVAGAALGLWMGSAVVSGTAEAGTCNDELTCARYAACLPGSNKLKSGGAYACEKVTSASSTYPTCSKLNSRNDWRWDRSDRVCFRTKGNGQRVEATSNRTCKSGYSYKSSSGKCEKAGGRSYYRSEFSKSSTGSFIPKSASSRSSASRKVACDSGYSLRTISTDRFACRKSVPAATANPTCKRLNSRSDWRWDRGGRVCFRTKRNGQRVEATSNITCAAGYTYDRSQGTCRRPGSIFYGPPIWK